MEIWVEVSYRSGGGRAELYLKSILSCVPTTSYVKVKALNGDERRLSESEQSEIEGRQGLQVRSSCWT